MLECNRIYLESERQRLLDKGDSVKTIVIHDYYLKGFVAAFSETDLKTLGRQQILSFIESLACTNYSDSYKRNVRHALKTFYRYLISESFSNFVRVGEMYGTLEKKKLLTGPEVEILIKVCSSLRDKAIIALFFDAALRHFSHLSTDIYGRTSGSDESCASYICAHGVFHNACICVRVPFYFTSVSVCAYHVPFARGAPLLLFRCLSVRTLFSSSPSLRIPVLRHGQVSETSDIFFGSCEHLF